jgi:hypothetical protein
MRSLLIRHRRLVAVILILLSLSLATGALFLAIRGQAGEYTGWGFRGFPAILSILFCTAGFLILNRRPGNAIAWLFIIAALLGASQALMYEYVIQALMRVPDSLPGGSLVAWVLNWYWMIGVTLLALTLVLFPNGKPFSQRWHYVMGLMVLVTFLGILVFAFRPGPLVNSFPAVANPLGQAWLEPLDVLTDMAVMYVYIITNFAAAAVAITLRFRRSRSVERQQMKWFVFAAFLLAATAILGPSDNRNLQAVFITAIGFLPVAMGIAIVRYRLYDIDIIIRKTLVYSLLTVTLALVYFGSVVVLQSLVAAVGGQQSSAVIVFSTLAIAALFSPLRRRLQDVIDRRFYRQKYDAQQVLARFAQTARDETDLDALTAELTRVVQETLQPEQVSVWLRK